VDKKCSRAPFSEVIDRTCFRLTPHVPDALVGRQVARRGTAVVAALEVAGVGILARVRALVCRQVARRGAAVVDPLISPSMLE
jgi:hypothetical protein